MTEVLGVIGSALAIIASLVAGGRYLLKTNNKLNTQLLESKKDLYRERVENLKAAISALETRLATTNEKLDVTMKQLAHTSKAMESTEKKMADYAEATERKIATFESAVVKLSNELIMLKTKKGSS